MEEKIEKIEEPKKPKVDIKEEIRKQRTWIEPHAVKLHNLRQQYEAQELLIKHTKENMEKDIFMRTSKIEISECPKEHSDHKKLLELDMKKTQVLVGINHFVRQHQILLDSIQTKIDLENKIINDIKNKILMFERNHKVYKPQDISNNTSEEKKDTEVKEE